VLTTPANVNDGTQALGLLHGHETVALGDAGYRGVDYARFSATPLLAPRVALWNPVVRHAPLVASELRKLGTAMRAYTLSKLGSGLFVAAAAIELMTRVEDPVEQWALVVCAMALLGVLMLAVADALADNDRPVRWLVGISAIRLEPRRAVVVVPLLFVPVLALLVGGPTALVHGARSAAIALFAVIVVVTSLVPIPPSDNLRLLGRSSMMAAWGLVAFYGIPSS
jgi:FtsH-binding integral membrane protein